MGNAKTLVLKKMFSLLAITVLALIARAPYAQNSFAPPSIREIIPNFGPVGMIVTVEGENFGQKRRTGDSLLLGTEESGYVEAPVYCWSDQMIKFRVPTGKSPGSYRLRVNKVADLSLGYPQSTSNKVPFVIMDSPKINSLNPTVSAYGQQVDIYGTGFGGQQEEANAYGFGYSTYVELYASNDRYRVIEYPKGWLGANHITIHLKNLLDVNTGLGVPRKQLYRGVWNLKVITDYFKDDGDTVYNLGMRGLDIDDNILYQAISKPIRLKIISP